MLEPLLRNEVSKAGYSACHFCAAMSFYITFKVGWNSVWDKRSERNRSQFPLVKVMTRYEVNTHVRER